MNSLIYPILALLTALCGILTGQGLLLVLAVVMLLVTGISFVLVHFSVRELELELQAPAVAEKGKPFTVQLNILKKSRIPCGAARVTLVCKNRLTGVTLREVFRSGMDEIQLTEQYCGCLDLSLESVRIYDWTGVLPVRYRKPCSRRVLVMPDTIPLEVSPRLAISNLMDAEEYSQYKKGQDRQETFQIREYLPGDALQQIHWKLSSKLDRLVVRDPSLPMDPSLLLFWDKSEAEPAVCDCLCEAFVSLAQAFAEAGVSFRMAWNGELIHTADVVGTDQLPEAVAELLKTEKPDPSLSGAALYLGTVGNAEAGRILYLSGKFADDIRSLSAHAEILLLYCGTDSIVAEETEDGVPVRSFTPDTYENELQDFCLE